MIEVTEYDWPSGDSAEVAVLRSSLDDLRDRFEFSQLEWIEDFGPYRGFGFRKGKSDGSIESPYPQVIGYRFVDEPS